VFCYQIGWVLGGFQRQREHVPAQTINSAFNTARPLGRTLWLLLAAILIVPLLVFAGAATVSYRSHFQEAEDRLIRFLDVVNEHAVKVFETEELAAQQVDVLLDDLSDADIIAREADLNAKLRQLVLRLPQVNDIWAIDATGHPLVTSNFMPAPRGLDLSDRRYFTVHRDRQLPPGTAYISEILHGRADPTVRFFQMSVRRERNGQFAGVIAISLEPKYFEAFYEQAARSGFDAVGLLREDGAFLARYPSRAGLPAQLPAQGTFRRAIEWDPSGGTFETVSAVDGVERLMAYRRLPNRPLYVAVGLSRQRILDAWRSAMVGHLIYGVPATLGLVLLTLLAIRRARREAEAIERLAKETQHRAAVEEQLRQSQKMEAIGRLTGGIAHDFNNLLQIAIGSLDILRRRIGTGDARSRELVQSALEGMTRAANLTQRLLAYARRQPLEPKTVDINRLVKDVSELLRSTLGETVHVETVLGGGLWAAYVDANQLENAVVNLAVNARDAMPDGGRLTIETANAHLDDAYAAATPEVAAGQYVMISITDTGTGMTPEVAAKAFEPFFTTKPPGQGTGLGLSQVYGFLKQSGGHVKIYSEPGSGTSVKLYLPRHYGATVQDDFRIDREALVAGASHATVLVVEDEGGVRRFACEALRDLGYTVLEAAGGRQALDLLAAHPEVALLLTDVVMPEMNGRELADRAQSLRPGLSVLFMTGYTRNAIVHNGVLDPQTRLISKPFTLSQLAMKVNEALAESPDSQPAAPPPEPDKAQPEKSQPDKARPDTIGSGKLRILVVDDEPLVALGLVDLLEEQGHTVVEATSAHEALNALTNGSFDLVVTDHTMPGMTGSQLARIIGERWPGIGVVLSTGHVDLPDPEIAKLPRLDKPYRVDQVRRAVEEAVRR
jgi:signal transduction histidine kinase/DNA-binding response OmpR family regulator